MIRKRPPAGVTKQSIRDELMRHVEQEAQSQRREDNNFHVLTLPGVEGVSNSDSFENQMLGTYDSCHVLGLEDHKPTWNAMMEGMWFMDPRFSLLRMRVDQYVKRACSSFDVIFLDYCGSADKIAIQTWKTMLDQEMLNSPTIFAVTICLGGRSGAVNRVHLGGNSCHHLHTKIASLVEASHAYTNCRKLFLREYSNSDVSRQSQDMMVGAFLID